MRTQILKLICANKEKHYLTERAVRSPPWTKGRGKASGTNRSPRRATPPPPLPPARWMHRALPAFLERPEALILISSKEHQQKAQWKQADLVLAFFWLLEKWVYIYPKWMAKTLKAALELTHAIPNRAVADEDCWTPTFPKSSITGDEISSKEWREHNNITLISWTVSIAWEQDIKKLACQVLSKPTFKTPNISCVLPCSFSCLKPQE